MYMVFFFFDKKSRFNIIISRNVVLLRPGKITTNRGGQSERQTIETGPTGNLSILVIII